MSHFTNGSNGYVNGHHGSTIPNRYDYSNPDEASAGARRDHRPAGYGGFNANFGDLSAPPDSAQGTSTALDDQSTGMYNGYEHPRRGPGERNHGEGQGGLRSSERNNHIPATLYGNGPAGRQIEGKPSVRYAQTWHSKLWIMYKPGMYGRGSLEALYCYWKSVLGAEDNPGFVLQMF